MLSAKRQAQDALEQPVKRQKVNGPAVENAPQITSSRQLQQALTFQQDAPGQLRSAIRSFKVFLESILYAEDRTTTGPQQKILKEYLESQLPKTSDKDAGTMLPNFTQAWSFATQANNDTLVSAVSAILALTLKTISTLIDFRDVGIQLCRTILQREQLFLISRALGSPKQKEHIISPSLRLLTEVVTFDGGILAKKVLAGKSKAFTFDSRSLTKNLSLWRPGAEDGQEDKRRPAVRSNAVRYLLANLKHQPNEGKVEILKSPNVILALFEHVQHDPVDVLKDIFDTLRIHVLELQDIPRSIKSSILRERQLSSVANIYRAERTSDETVALSQRLAHDFLSYVCTVPKAGILRSYAGWYPPGTDSDDGRGHDVAEIALGLDSVEWFNRFQTQVPIQNPNLAAFAQKLHPLTSTSESELLIKIFRSAPELVADYYFKKTGFAFDPKLTATWIGYGSLLFSTIHAPVPSFFGPRHGYRAIPPPTSIVMQNLLPEPLTQKVLTRCLNQQTSLITFFAIQILVAAFSKLHRVLERYREAAEFGGPLWEDGAKRLIAAFTQRCPTMKDIIATYKKIQTSEKLQLEAMLHLLSLYYQVTPQVAAEDRLDIAPALACELAHFSIQDEGTTDQNLERDTGAHDDPLRSPRLEHMLHIAAYSPDMRWFHKTENQKFSPYVSLLKLIATMRADNIPLSVWDLVRSVSEDNGILQWETERGGIYALCGSLKPDPTDDWSPSDAVFIFLDDVCGRIVRKPIKYEDDLDEVTDENETSEPISPVHMALAEQWPFSSARVKDDASDKSSMCIARFLSRYWAASTAIGEDHAVISDVVRNASSVARESQRQFLLQYKQSDLSSNIDTLAFTIKRLREGSILPPIPASDHDTLSLPQRIPSHLLGPLPEHPDSPALHRWSSKDIPTALADNDLPPLIICLSSSDPDVAHAALLNLRSFHKQLHHLHTTNQAICPDSQQLWLLLGILLNTVERGGFLDTVRGEIPESQPAVPALLTTYASLASRVLLDPLNPLYDAINQFHLKGPQWDVERLVSYWVHTILFTGVEESRSLRAGTSKADTPGRYPALDELEGADNEGNTLVNGDGKERGGRVAPTVEAAVVAADISTPLRFLLSFVYESLRDERSLEIVGRKGVLEHVASVVLARPHGSESEGVVMLLHIWWRITYLEGGSDMLLMWKGVLGLLQGMLQKARRQEATVGPRADKGGAERQRNVLLSAWGLRQLVRRIWVTCDKESVAGWSGGTAEAVVHRLLEQEQDTRPADVAKEANSAVAEV